MEKGPQDTECRQPLEAGKGKERFSKILLEPLEGRQPCQHGDFSPVRPIPDFWPQNYENRFAPFEVPKLVVICYSSDGGDSHWIQLLQPHDCSLPDSSVRGISQARIPEWVAIPF